MKQLTLDLHADHPPQLENFVAASNADLLAALYETIPVADVPQHLFLWGDAGSGRSHLLKSVVTAAAQAGRPACYYQAADVGEMLPEAPSLLLAVDDVEALGPEAQIALFRAFNAARGLRMTLVTSGCAAPLHLSLREDLRTRIGQSLIFEVKSLTDDDRTAILDAQAAARGLRLEPEIVQYLLRHGRRDLTSLLRTLDALDAASLERKRAITLPLLREILQRDQTL
ncbi:DnaA regulatory inactivator Hda [Zoogloea sp.]|uniref:DnaA regulatory inactivator Hda n=1 Tax=Zoogloea sp. TaxID=49181 RepID=UPI00260C8649|nr:DnaA regulatory inactivator Hda [Zoogloea sp.]MDD3353856.1 DnaA regulatory inactivator Hda [Zoogloea sp.]